MTSIDETETLRRIAHALEKIAERGVVLPPETRPGSIGAMLVECQERVGKILTALRVNPSGNRVTEDAEYVIRSLYTLVHNGGDYWNEGKWEIKAVRRRKSRTEVRK